jgi:hypothetical protein
VGNSFSDVFKAAWKANAEFSLNGIASQPEWMVFVHALRFWNRSHGGPYVVLGVPRTTSTTVGTWNATPEDAKFTLLYSTVLSLIADVHRSIPNPDPILVGSVQQVDATGNVTAGVNINVGPAKQLGVSLPSVGSAGGAAPTSSAAATSGTGMSTTTKVAATGVAAGAAVVVAAGIYSMTAHMPIGAVFKRTWSRVFK